MLGNGRPTVSGYPAQTLRAAIGDPALLLRDGAHCDFCPADVNPSPTHWLHDISAQ